MKMNAKSDASYIWRIHKLLDSHSLKIAKKSLTQHCERSELSLHFEWTSSIKIPNMANIGEFLETCSSVTRQVSFNRTKIGGKCQIEKKSNATF